MVILLMVSTITRQKRKQQLSLHLETFNQGSAVNSTLQNGILTPKETPSKLTPHVPSGVGDGNAGDLAMRGSERRSICTSKLRSSIGERRSWAVYVWGLGLRVSALDMYSAIAYLAAFMGFGDPGFAISMRRHPLIVITVVCVW